MYNHQHEDRIYDDALKVLSKYTNSKGSNLNGLLSGYWGVLFFIFYYERYNNIKNDYGSVFLSTLYNDIQGDITSDFSYCNGLSGVFWLLNHLNKNEFISIEHNDIFSDFIRACIWKDKWNIKCQNYDFLHGSTGVCHFLIDFADIKEVKEYLESYVVALKQISVLTPDGISLPVFSVPNDENKTDAFSLAHGTCSIQILLIKFHKAGINPAVCRDLIYGSMEFILRHQHSPSCHSMFPSHLAEKGHFSRVSWCYGDLGVAIALWQCGKYFNERKWLNKALDILHFNSKRNTLETGGIKDICLCHGTAGNAAIYQRFWHETNDKVFFNCAEDWYNLTEQMIIYPLEKNVHGVKIWKGTQEKWQFSWDLLNGSAGVALSLLSRQGDLALPWDEFLLIS